MSTAAKCRKTRGAKPQRRRPADTTDEAMPELPDKLRRSAVYRKVPPAVRIRLEESLLLRPAGLEHLKRIHESFKLQDRYGVSADALRRYARLLEAFVRPVMANHLMSGLLGCMPRRYRERLVAGSQVLLLSRVVQALTRAQPEAQTAADSGETDDADPLSVSELAKLASILSSLTARVTPDGAKTATKRSKQKSTGSQTGRPGDAQNTKVDHDKLSEAVRMLYGLDWPAEKHANSS